MRGRAMVLFASMTVLAGCGGGGLGSSTPGLAAIPVATSTPIVTPTPVVKPTPVVNPTPPVTASVSQTITAAAGGTVSTVLDGQTVTVTVPAGALSTSTSVTLSVYAAAGLPRLFQSRLRTPKALPTGAAFITGMGLTIGSATLTKPVSFRLAGAPNALAGTVVRLAASVQGSFGDIDTATEANGTISEAQNPAYAGVSLAGPSVLYAFYRVPSANALAVPAVTVSVAGPSSVVGGSQAQYSAAEIDANGFPFLTSSYSFSVDSAALGTIDAATGILTSPTANNIIGHVIATDLRTAAISGSLAVTVLSARPATAGDSLSYAGTLSSSISNDAISSSPVTSNQTAAVAQTIAISAGASNGVTVTGKEVDQYQLSTLTTTTAATLAYQTSGSSTAVRMLQSTANDSNGAAYQTQFTPTSGLLTVEPENAGAFGPNDASQTYSETDPGINVGSSGQNVTTTRTTAANGSYQETTTNADATINVAVENADGSGSYAIQSSSAGPVQLTFGLPTTGTNATIPLSLVVSNFNVKKTVSAPLWYPLPLALYAESDTIAASSGYDSRCNVPAVYGTAASKVTQVISSVDAVYGNLENQTTTAYDVAGIGTVCSIFTDTTQTFYDYSGQEPSFISFNSAASPILSSTLTEVLSITAAAVSGAPVATTANKRSTRSLSHLALVVGRERFRHAVHRAKIAQGVRAAAALRRLQGLH
jgi:hypothetical protein